MVFKCTDTWGVTALQMGWTIRQRIRCFALILIGIDPEIGFRLFLGLFSGQGSVIFYAR